MTLDPRDDLEAELEALATDAYTAKARDLALDLRSLLLPPEDITTVDCADRYRYLRAREGDGKRKYSSGFTPYMVGPQDALDDPRYKFVVVVGPGRTGKSVAGENHLFKRLRNGPLTDTIIYLQAESDVSSYADKEFGDFFDPKLHPEIAGKLGPLTSDRKRDFKRVAGRTIQLLPANLGNVRQKEATFIIATELDGYRASVRDGFKDNIATRMQASGNQAKAYVESHPDMGWAGGVATIWKDSTRGLWFWPCPHCLSWSCPHPLAPKGMHMRLDFDRDDTRDEDARLDLVESSARLLCPHCGSLLSDDDRTAMLARGGWVFAGQTIAADGTVTGTARRSETAGFWIHGSMSPMVRLGELARALVAATVFYERTKKPRRLKEVTVKKLGEVYEGAGSGTRVIDPVKLEERGREVAAREGFTIGTAPPEVLFVTAAVDPGGSKFDVLWTGWDLEGRSWFIDRQTFRQRRVNGRLRDIRTAERQEDWLVLRDEVLTRLIPLQADPTMALPVAAVAIDTGDGNVTWKAREFARAMAKAGFFWGKPAAPWQRVRLIKGAASARATELPVKGREINTDEQGNRITPSIMEFDLGVHRLKTLSVERLAEQEGGPGYVRFAEDLPRSAFEELAGEVLVDDKWDRRGPNETLDLFGYNEAARLMLRPERADIHWDERPPIWARPVPFVETVIPAAPTRVRSSLDRLAALNRR